jgi:predicted enzyme related to lactoylglutathione lyase
MSSWTIRDVVEWPVAGLRPGWHDIDGDRRLAFRRIADRCGFPWLTVSRLRELLLSARTLRAPPHGEPREGASAIVGHLGSTASNPCSAALLTSVIVTHMALRAPVSPDDPPLTLGRVVILVRDYDAALGFYQAAFGARVLFDAPTPSGDRYLHIGLGPESADSVVHSRRAPEVGFWLLRPAGAEYERVGRQTGGEPLAVLYTPDVRGALTRVTAAGGVVVRPVETADGASFAHVADLYGNEFVLVEVPANAGLPVLVADG